MLKAFFDTTVYNHLKKEQSRILKRLIDHRGIEILTTTQILGELAATFEKDIKRMQELADLYSEVISQRTIKLPPDLLRDEMDYFNGGTKKSIFLDSGQEKQFRQYIEDFKQGKIDKHTKEFVRYIKDKKKKNKADNKKIKREIDKLWDKEKVSEFPNFETFYKHGFKTGDVRRQIESYLERIIHPSQKHLISVISKRVEANLPKMPHFETAVKIVPALSYRYHIQKKGAEWGDVEDILNLIAVTMCDCYVSDDKGAREMAMLLFPNKIILSLDSFISKIERKIGDIS